MSVIVENPEGQIVLGVSKDNPYKNEDPLVVEDSTAQPLLFGEVQVMLPPDTFRRALELEKRSQTIRFLCILDLFINMLTFLTYGYTGGLLISLISMLGYYGALRYRRLLLIGYLVYQVLLTISRVGVIVYLIYTHETQNVALMILLPILAITQGVITNFVWKFYNMLPNSCT